MPHFIGNVVEGRVPVDLVVGGLEIGSAKDGSEAAMSDERTTQIELPSPRRV
jgi:hypothetical protein